MAGTTETHLDPLSDVDDELRSLLSAILDGRRTEQVYLRDVSTLCRAKPQSGHPLLLCIDRYRRLGRMSVSQHEKVKACIARALSEAAAEAFDAQHAGELREQNTSDLAAKPAYPTCTCGRCQTCETCRRIIRAPCDCRIRH
jgi:hypothetical protein